MNSKKCVLAVALGLSIMLFLSACSPNEVAQAGPAVWLDRPLDGSHHPLAPVHVQAHARPEQGGSIAELQLFINGGLVTRLANADPAAPLVNFEQDYDSNNLSNRMHKRQYWMKRDGRWQIVYEGAA